MLDFSDYPEFNDWLDQRPGLRVDHIGETYYHASECRSLLTNDPQRQENITRRAVFSIEARACPLCRTESRKLLTSNVSKDYGMLTNLLSYYATVERRGVKATGSEISELLNCAEHLHWLGGFDALTIQVSTLLNHTDTVKDAWGSSGAGLELLLTLTALKSIQVGDELVDRLLGDSHQDFPNDFDWAMDHYRPEVLTRIEQIRGELDSEWTALVGETRYVVLNPYAERALQRYRVSEDVLLLPRVLECLFYARNAFERQSFTLEQVDTADLELVPDASALVSDTLTLKDALDLVRVL